MKYNSYLERRVESSADDLNTRRGIVSGRVALLPRSTEIQPCVAPIRPSPLPTRFCPPPPEVRDHWQARLGTRKRCTCAAKRNSQGPRGLLTPQDELRDGCSLWPAGHATDLPSMPRLSIRQHAMPPAWPAFHAEALSSMPRRGLCPACHALALAGKSCHRLGTPCLSIRQHAGPLP